MGEYLQRDEALAIIGKGIDYWNNWRNEHPDHHIFLSNSIFPTKDLSGINFSGINLEHTDLSNINLSNSNLEKTIFRGANLSNAIIKNSNLIQTSLLGANLNGADLSESNLKEANLGGATLLKARTIFQKDMYGDDHRDINEFIKTEKEKGSLVVIAAGYKYRLPVFDVTRFTKTNLTNCNLEGANLVDATLDEAKLNGTIFKKAKFGGTTINCDFSKAFGLNETEHTHASNLSTSTISSLSQRTDANFLRGCGLPEPFMEYFSSKESEVSEFYSCFISYNHDDKEFANYLYNRLQEHGIRCWLDEHQMLPGDDIYEQIDNGIKSWDKVLLCCSENSLGSWWVDNEIDTAFEKERILMKQRSKKTLALIPIDLDGYMFTEKWKSGKKRQILSRLSANFNGWEKTSTIFDSEFKRVVKALRSDQGVREKPPESKI